MTKKKSNQQTIEEVFLQFVKANGLARNYEEYQVQEAYKKLMGAPIVKYTTDLYFKNGRLHVTLSSSVMRDELSMGKSRFIELINKELGDKIVLDVVFV
jgi:hypothetical protein